MLKTYSLRLVPSSIEMPKQDHTRTVYGYLLSIKMKKVG
jgi:hypothetical protein